MTSTKDWNEWHSSYADPESRLSRRLHVVRQQIGAWLDAHPGRPLTVVSVCAGQGHDLLAVLAERADAGRVRAQLIEYDPRNVAAARARLATLDLPDITVMQGDAGELSSYAGAVPADLVLLAGVLGNITDTDVQATIAALPQFCAADATVIWTRSRREPDLTPAVRGWLADSGFQELTFVAPADELFSVGTHRFTGTPQALSAGGTLFRFVR